MHSFDRRSFLGVAALGWLSPSAAGREQQPHSPASIFNDGISQADARKVGLDLKGVRPDLGPDFWPGLDGSVHMVATLADLKRALTVEGNKLILLTGDVDLKGEKLSIKEGTTISGRFAEKAPQLIRGEVRINGSRVRLDHICIRPGDLDNSKSPWEPDGLMIMGKGIKDIVVSNCSLTWGVDENASVTGKIRDGAAGAPSDILFYRCLIAQSLHRTKTHSKNDNGAKGHGCGLLIYDFSQRVAIVESLFASNFYRNPMVKANTTVSLHGNVIANPGQQIVKFQPVPSEYEGTGQTIRSSTAILTNNILLRGPDTAKERPFVEALAESKVGKRVSDLRPRVYLSGNAEFSTLDFARNSPEAATHANVQAIALGADGLTPLSQSDAIAQITRVLACVGAFPAVRHLVDEKVVLAVRTGNSSPVIDSQNDVGGYPRPSKSSGKAPRLPTDPQERLRILTQRGEEIGRERDR